MFTYEIQCDPDILECSTIKFILQPVLENCFKHGLKDVRSAGFSAETDQQDHAESSGR